MKSREISRSKIGPFSLAYTDPYIGIGWEYQSNVTKSYRKLMNGQINDTKHIKTLISRHFGNSLDLRLVGDLYFFLSTEHELVGK